MKQYKYAAGWCTFSPACVPTCKHCTNNIKKTWSNILSICLTSQHHTFCSLYLAFQLGMCSETVVHPKAKDLRPDFCKVLSQSLIFSRLF